MNEWFEKDWAAIEQIFKILLTIKQGEEVREEILHGLASPKHKTGKC